MCVILDISFFNNPKDSTSISPTILKMSVNISRLPSDKSTKINDFNFTGQELEHVARRKSRGIRGRGERTGGPKG